MGAADPSTLVPALRARILQTLQRSVSQYVNQSVCQSTVHLGE